MFMVIPPSEGAFAVLYQWAVMLIPILGFLFVGVRNYIADKKLEKIKKTGEAIHTLSNSAMGAQLKKNVQFAKANAILYHRLAVISGIPSDLAAAMAADVVTESEVELLNTHLAQQAKVDSDAAAATAHGNSVPFSYLNNPDPLNPAIK
jgi:hypothetical protein